MAIIITVESTKPMETVSIPPPTPPPSNNNIREGYMFIQSHSVWKPWTCKAKYFILTPDYLYCFKRRGDLTSIPCDMIMLSGVSVAIDDAKKNMRKRFYLKLVSASQRKSMNVFCFSEDERNEWFTMIMQTIAKIYVSRLGHVKKKTEERSIWKTRSLEDSTFKLFLPKSVLAEQNKALSISCLELTNMSVLPDDPSLPPTPITKSFHELDDTFSEKRATSAVDIFRSLTSVDEKHPFSFLRSPRLRHRQRPSSLLILPSSSPDMSNCDSPRRKTRKNKSVSQAIVGMNVKNNGGYVCVQ